jgi:hypothetical protein
MLDDYPRENNINFQIFIYSMDEKKIRSKISEGFLHVRAIIEVVGKPKEFVEDSLKGYMKTLREDHNYTLTKETIEEATIQDGLFSAFAEIEFLAKDAQQLVSFCFDYMPSSVEIIEPDTTLINNTRLSGLLNDLQARLHAMNSGVVQIKSDNEHLIKNTAVLLRNFVVVLLSSKPLNSRQLHAYMGVSEASIEQVINVLIKEGKIKKQGEVFTVISNEIQKTSGQETRREQAGDTKPKHKSNKRK